MLLASPARASNSRAFFHQNLHKQAAMKEETLEAETTLATDQTVRRLWQRITCAWAAFQLNALNHQFIVSAGHHFGISLTQSWLKASNFLWSDSVLCPCHYLLCFAVLPAWVWVCQEISTTATASYYLHYKWPGTAGVHKSWKTKFDTCGFDRTKSLLNVRAVLFWFTTTCICDIKAGFSSNVTEDDATWML